MLNLLRLMSVSEVLLILVAVYLAIVGLGWLVLVPILRRGPTGTALIGLMWRVERAYCRLWHRATYGGAEILPKSDADHQGLIVVSNHTGAIDPLAIQARCRFLIRWMMASDMMGPELNWLWLQQQMIPVKRDGSDSAALREAIRHVRAGGAIGIFPEGRITIPPRQVRPFLPGVGLLIAKAKAPVLLAWVSGTPNTNSMSLALKTPSRTHVQFIDLIDFGEERDAAKITEHLRQRIAEVSGWPLNDEIIPPGGPREDADETD
ncbi:MAG: 1-acyl-sn-glycerol-3-phosphate acyltransferase [Phycisphaerales bacterium]|nr:MAG: 1-acyl-sn-glycerol-3-phosphate acyltransferase [Phycisphaerales bacterium]